MSIEHRKFTVCPSEANYDFSRLILECGVCGRLSAACLCHHNFFGDLYQSDEPSCCCHHLRVVFTDGACSNNGQHNAKAGLGITIGSSEKYCWSIAVDDAVDGGAPRTNQRAELLAAITGLRKLEVSHPVHPKQKHLVSYIVVTDSEYVVKGITEWFPAWRSRGWRTSSGEKPTNLDLFLELDDVVTKLEQGCMSVGFWQVPRALNDKADRLAKLACMG